VSAGVEYYQGLQGQSLQTVSAVASRYQLIGGYVNSVIEFGEKLIETKKQIPHGGWEKFCENGLKNAFKSLPGGVICSQQQAHKFMPSNAPSKGVFNPPKSLKNCALWAVGKVDRTQLRVAIWKVASPKVYANCGE
jgi:hypothetical protein